MSVSKLSKRYEGRGAGVTALDRVSFDVSAGSLVVIMGPSGSGKSTLLHLLGGLDSASEGSVLVDGQELNSLGDEELTLFRRRRLGFIFQFFNLLPTLTAWENVGLPLLLDGRRMEEIKERAVDLLALVGLESRKDHKPAQLSGGEMQRIAIARALVADPVLLLADEPTGNLDSHSGEVVLELLRSAVKEQGKTLVMVTHDSSAALLGDRKIMLEDGRLIT